MNLQLQIDASLLHHEHSVSNNRSLCFSKSHSSLRAQHDTWDGVLLTIPEMYRINEKEAEDQLKYVMMSCELLDRIIQYNDQNRWNSVFSQVDRFELCVAFCIQGYVST